MIEEERQVIESSLQSWLSFVSSLLWPFVVFTVVWSLRKEIRLLIKRIAKVKYGDTEIAFQTESKDAVELGGKAAAQIDLIDPEGFFTMQGMADLIEKSGLVESNDKATEVLLLFRTRKQRTWLIATTKWLFCVLDDEETRRSKRLIQWRLALDEANPIVARASRAETGSVDIGPRKRWLYSYSLFPEPNMVEDEIRTRVNKAKSKATE